MKKEIAIFIATVALAVGFLGGIFYSAFNTPSGPPGSQPAAQNALPGESRIEVLKKELLANPDDINALIELGDIYFDGNRYETAIAIFNKAEEVAPANIHVLNDLGILYMSTGKYDAALEKFETVMDVDSSHIHSLYHIGVIHRIKGDTGKALGTFEQIMSKSPEPKLAEAVRQEIAALKNEPPPSGFPGADSGGRK
jgi:cytochrome c-type biogenesis protein CcmH/NrfG